MSMPLRTMDYCYEPWLKGGWEKILNGELALRTGTVIMVDRVERGLWSTGFSSESNSNILYLFSLEWVGTLLTGYQKTGVEEYREEAGKYIEKFIEFVGGDYKRLTLPSSTDHSYFNRVCVLTKALRVFPPDWSLRDEIITLLVHHGEWMADDNHHYPNNHGVMTDFGLLHLAVLFEKTGYGPVWLAKAAGRLEKLLHASFDDEGMNNENTIGYHWYNMTLFKAVAGYMKHYGLAPQLVEDIETTMSRAGEALSCLIRPDGSVPPIGDSPVYKPGLPSINRSRHFRKENFVVIKKDDFYISFKCGWTTPVHKHIDESSITVWYKNIDLVVDGGSYNYDRADPVRRFLQSAQGHSAIFPVHLDNVELGKYLRECREARIEEFIERTGSAYARCRYELVSSGTEVVREIETDYRRLIVRDRWHSKAETEMRQRFLLSPQAQLDNAVVVQENKHQYVFSSGGLTFSFTIVADRSDIFFDSGWYSPERNVKHQNRALDTVVCRERGDITAIIEIAP